MAAGYTLPGTSAYAYVMLPIRLIVWLTVFALMYPLMLLASFMRAVYLRLVVGSPSRVLKFGTYNNTHNADEHYPCMLIFDQPINEQRFRQVLNELAAEAGIPPEKMDLKWEPEEPNDWPNTGSWDIDYFINSNKTISPDSAAPGPLKAEKDRHYWDYWIDRGAMPASGSKEKWILRMRVFNGRPQKPTIVWWAGSGNAWDGSANFNFFKEACERYAGNQRKNVFQKPEINPESAAKADSAWFVWFLMKLPYHIARNFGTFSWNMIRATKWAGGNGFGFKITAMNFNVEESARLKRGCEAMGIKPFAAFTYAANKACAEVYKQPASYIVQQASIQRQHFPLPGQGEDRDLVGDWLIGATQNVSQPYTLDEAGKAHKDLIQDLREFGPMTKTAFMAKAYGFFNSGAAGFQGLPTYGDVGAASDGTIFMNNYGVRTIDKRSGFHTFNWNAPLWCGVNTINVNGRTTTLVGTAFFGIEALKAFRDNMEATLRGIMAKASGGQMEAHTVVNIVPGMHVLPPGYPVVMAPNGV